MVHDHDHDRYNVMYGSLKAYQAYQLFQEALISNPLSILLATQACLEPDITTASSADASVAPGASTVASILSSDRASL